MAIVYIFIFFSAFIAFWLEYITSLFCDPPDYFAYGTLNVANPKWAEVNGKAVNMSKWVGESSMAAEVSKYPGYDLSPMFPTFTLLAREQDNSTYSDPDIQKCIGDLNMTAAADRWLTYRISNDTGYLEQNQQLTSCPLPNANGSVTGAPCYYHESDLQELQKGIKGGKHQKL